MRSKQAKHGNRYTVTLSDFEERTVLEIAKEQNTKPTSVIKQGVLFAALAHKMGRDHAQEVA